MTIKRLLGSAPSQVSRNKDLGTMAFQDANNLSLPELAVNKQYTVTTSTPGYSSYTVYSGTTVGVYNVQRIAQQSSSTYSTGASTYNGGVQMFVSGYRNQVTNTNVTGTSIPLLNFKYFSLNRGSALTTIKYQIDTDGGYSSLSGELYLHYKCYNGTQYITKTTDRTTTRNIVEHHVSAGTDYLNYLYLGTPPAVDVDGTIPLYVYGTGTQFGAYTMNFTLEITTLSSKDSGAAFGLYDISA